MSILKNLRSCLFAFQFKNHKSAISKQVCDTFSTFFLDKKGGAQKSRLQKPG
jgi:hypothetical protein